MCGEFVEEGVFVFVAGGFFEFFHAGVCAYPEELVDFLFVEAERFANGEDLRPVPGAFHFAVDPAVEGFAGEVGEVRELFDRKVAPFDVGLDLFGERVVCHEKIIRIKKMNDPDRR